MVTWACGQTNIPTDMLIGEHITANRRTHSTTSQQVENNTNEPAARKQHRASCRTTNRTHHEQQTNQQPHKHAVRRANVFAHSPKKLLDHAPLASHTNHEKQTQSSQPWTRLRMSTPVPAAHIRNTPNGAVTADKLHHHWADQPW